MSAKLKRLPILIVGGSGFLGHHLIEDLVDKGLQPEQLHILDIKPKDSQHPGVAFHCADITSAEDVRKVLKLVRPGLIFHTASPYPFESDRRILESINVDGTRNLVKISQQVGCVEGFVYTSSSSVIHNYYHPLRRADESYPVLFFPQQPNYYSHTKALAEGIVLSANRKGGKMLTAALRPASMYGEGDTTQTGNLVKNARAGRSNNRIGSEENLFDNTYIKNLTHAEILTAEALLSAGEAEALPHDRRVEGEAFFITDNDSYSFPGYTRLVAKLAGHPVDPAKVRTIPLWLMLSLVYIAQSVYWIVTFGKEMAFSTKVVRMLAQERTFSVEKAKVRLGYQPLYSTAEGTRRAVEWYVKHENIREAGDRTR